MRRILFLIALLLPLANARPQGYDSLFGIIKKPVNTSDKFDIEEARHAVLSEDFDKALYIYGNIIESQKERRAQGTQVDNGLMAEYAYLLALVGAQEAALVNIDLALNLKWPSPTIYYYVGSVMELVGFGDLSAPFVKIGKQPSWLHGKGPDLNKRYKAPVLLTIERTDYAMRHITQCIRENRYVEGLCYATYLTRLVPDMQGAWLLQSAAFEKLGCYTFALQSYEKGIALSSEENLPGMAAQVAYLKKKSLKTGNVPATWQMTAMAYGGLTYSNHSTSINGRYGVSSGPLSMSVSMSINIPEHGDFSYYAGLSGFYNIGKVFGGLGMGLQTNGSATTFTLSPTLGISFINSRRTSSFDISMAWNIPCRAGMKSALGISIGKTFYFNLNGK